MSCHFPNDGLYGSYSGPEVAFWEVRRSRLTKNRSPLIPSGAYLRVSNALLKISPTLNASGHCFNYSTIGSAVLAVLSMASRSARITRLVWSHELAVSHRLHRKFASLF